jgi:hypothetical protein
MPTAVRETKKAAGPRRKEKIKGNEIGEETAYDLAGVAEDLTVGACISVGVVGSSSSRSAVGVNAGGRKNEKSPRVIERSGRLTSCDM